MITLWSIRLTDTVGFGTGPRMSKSADCTVVLPHGDSQGGTEFVAVSVPRDTTNTNMCKTAWLSGEKGSIKG